MKTITNNQKQVAALQKSIAPKASTKDFVGPTAEEQQTQEMSVKADKPIAISNSKAITKIEPVVKARPAPAVMSVGKRIIK